MNEQELEHKLTQALLDKELTNIALDEGIEKIKSQLTEAAKPTLRHLDYGYDSDGDLRICLIKYDNTFTYAGPRCLRKELTEGYYPIVDKKGNLADDLKAMSEPLEEWTSTAKSLDGKTFEIECDKPGRVWLGVTGNAAWYNIKDAEEIHCKLGQAIHTAKLDAKT